MLLLPNNCRAGKISVTPSNWKKPGASTKKPWAISYWFYDDNLGSKIKVVIKGMNRLDTAFERKEATQLLMDDEIDLIQNKGYNRITKSFSYTNDADISGFTPLMQALYFAFENLR